MPELKKAFDGTKIGDRFVWSPHTDVHSYTVDAIISPKKILVTEDACDYKADKRPNYAKAISNPDGHVTELSARKLKSGKYAGEYVWKRVGASRQSGAFHKTDEPYCYYDPSF